MTEYINGNAIHDSITGSDAGHVLLGMSSVGTLNLETNASSMLWQLGGQDWLRFNTSVPAISLGNATDAPAFSLTGSSFEFSGTDTIDLTGTAFTLTGTSLEFAGSSTIDLTGTAFTLTGTSLTFAGTGAISLTGTTLSITGSGAATWSASSFDLTISGNDFLNISSSNVSLGNATTNPTYQFLGTGPVKFAGSAGTSGYVLTSTGASTAPSWQTVSAGVTLDQAYDFGGAGAGRTITADSGAVTIAGTSGFTQSGGPFTFTGSNFDLDPTGDFTLDMDSTKKITITIADNLADAFVIQETANTRKYIAIDTLDGLEVINFGYSSFGKYVFQGASSEVRLNGNDLAFTAGQGFSIGTKNTFRGSNSMCIGNGAHAGGQYSIAIGQQLSLGSTDHIAGIGGGGAGYIDHLYIGNGIVDTQNPATITFQATSGAGNDRFGSDLAIAAGQPTGSAAGGDIIFYTAPGTTTGTLLRPLVERLRITDAGYLVITPPGGSTDFDVSGYMTFGSGLVNVNDVPFRWKGAHGEYFKFDQLHEDHTLALAATSDTSIQIPANCYCTGITARIETTITGCATLDIGVAGDTTRYATGLALTSGTTTAGHDSAAPFRYYGSATSIRFSAIGGGGSFTAGIVRITIHYAQLSAQTS